MEIYNIDNEHLMTHRYGWHNIILTLQTKINVNIVLVDFMDKYFNKWFELNKDIICENKLYKFINKDVYYKINDEKSSDIFIYYDEFQIYHIIKWYEEYNEFKMLYGELMLNYKKRYNSIIIDKPWIGILHYPEFTKDMNITSYESLPYILQSITLQESFKNCKAIITLSEHLKKYILDNLAEYKYNIPIKVLYHPTDFNCKKFSLVDYSNNDNKKIIQLGFWMRNMKTIYCIKTDKFTKYWLPGGKYWIDMFKSMYKESEEYMNDESVNIKMYLSNSEYDDILSNNICLVDVYNSSANNSVLECIARNTPLLVNKHPAIIEYLNEDYPLYYENIDELNTIINSDNFDKRLIESHNYLKNMDKKRFTIDYFCDEFKNFVEELL